MKSDSQSQREIQGANKILSLRDRGGPRTAVGKQRARFNALKDGIFSDKILEERGESRARYKKLLLGFINYFHPEGEPERLLVEKLAMCIWRQPRVLRAELAEILNGSEFVEEDGRQRQLLAKQNHRKSLSEEDGLLHECMDPATLKEAIGQLQSLRDLVEGRGLFWAEDARILLELYGTCDSSGYPPLGFFRVYKSCCDKYNQESNEKKAASVTANALGRLDAEIKRLQDLIESITNVEQKRIRYNADASWVPQLDKSERLMRNEAHLSREFDRILSQLERLRRMRSGLPMPPAIKVEVSS
jgi:hypothetical protein